MAGNLPRVFVTGCPRSGTSFMQVLLHSIPGLCGSYTEDGPFESAEPGAVVKRPYKPHYVGDIAEALRLGYHVVIMLRDGRDVMSSRHPLVLDGGYDEGYYIKQDDLWLEAVDTQLSAVNTNRPDVMVVRYETLIADVQGTLLGIAKWLGLPGPPNNPEEQLALVPKSSVLHHAMSRRQKVAYDRVGRWKSDSCQVRRIMAGPLAARFSKRLTDFGYT